MRKDARVRNVVDDNNNADVITSNAGHNKKSFLTPATRRKRLLVKQQKAMERRKTMLVLVLVVALFLLVGSRVDPTIYSTGRATQHTGVSQPRLRGKTVTKCATSSWIPPKAHAFNENSDVSRTNHLVVVAGHSVIINGNLEDAGTDENVWFLLDYQKGQGLPQAIVAHIQAGIDEATKDPKALLVFSGGETRAGMGPINEGTSYFRVADALNLWNDDTDKRPHMSEIMDAPMYPSVRSRAVAEEFATDSYQNLLFSICRFKEVTGSYPKKITVVSFSFKETRFEQLHAHALHWPSNQFHYVGVDPPVSTGFNLERSKKGEAQNSVVPFQTDPYACHSDVLKQKRRERNPFSRTPPYLLTCPEISDLLQWCGPDLIAKSKIPWAEE